MKMATIKDLNKRLLSQMSDDGALEHIRNIRLTRVTKRTPTKRQVKKTKDSKALNKTIDSLSPEQALEALQKLGVLDDGNSNPED